MFMRKLLLSTFLLLAFAGLAMAQVTAEEAKQLGTSLTAVGAELAGNADGSIPAYSEDLGVDFPKIEKGSGMRPDPFARDKKLFSKYGPKNKLFHPASGLTRQSF